VPELSKQAERDAEFVLRWSQMIRCGFTQDGIKERRFDYTTTIPAKSALN